MGQSCYQLCAKPFLRTAVGELSRRRLREIATVSQLIWIRTSEKKPQNRLAPLVQPLIIRTRKKLQPLLSCSPVKADGMLTHLDRPREPLAIPTGRANPAHLHSLTHRQAVDLFHATKANIVGRALCSIESIRLLGSFNPDFSNAAQRLPNEQARSSESIVNTTKEMS